MENPIEKIEKTLENMEGKVEKFEKKVEQEEKKLLQNKWVQSAGFAVLVLVIAGGFLYYQETSTRINIDKSQIQAPLIGLSASVSGPLNQIFVSEGDKVQANEPVAQVGDDIIKTKVTGIIVSVNNNLGTTFNPGQTVITMIGPTALRVVGTIDENKGLKNIRVGQLASFTVDAYGSKKYEGVVDEISPTSNQTGVVFNISDQRATQTFDIKVRFNIDKYPELKNGMSAKITIFTK